MALEASFSDYGWSQQMPHTESYLWESLQLLIKELVVDKAQVLDLSFGNRALVVMLARWGYRPIGVQPSSSAIQLARQQSRHLKFHQASADPAELASLALPAFDVVLSTEVVEYVYLPRRWAAAAYSVLKPGGVLICPNPCQDYLKNCASVCSGKLDAPFSALWDGGHIKFWSSRTLTALLQETGFHVMAFRAVCWLQKSMILVARKPTL